ncbi:radical SAM protein [Candidatus Pacearchaeota archaeon]|nr:radical SAM protein [Candidatus Pacearchaeota archaeon]
MKEWNNKYNAFNSWKGLMWREWFEGFAKEDYLVPIQIDTDPANSCNYDWIWCNAMQYMEDKKNAVIPKDHLIKLADFYAEWGVKSSCLAGGGEPLLNPGLKDFLLRLNNNNIAAGLITNGSLLNDELIETIVKTCRWVGVSVDAGTPDTYIKVKGIKNSNLFDVVIRNIEKLAKEIKRTGYNCDLAYKYLFSPYNAEDIYVAAQLAKQIGVKDFHLRPVGWDNVPKTKNKGKIDYTDKYDLINKEIEQSLLLETDDFHFYGVRHKFKEDFQRNVPFKRCWAAPLVLTFGADGNCHLCFDMRGRKDLILCSHYPDPKEVLKHWNSERHKEIMRNIKVEDCPRCTFGPYNEFVENIFIEDKMCRYFP